jgi:hypothetical protein
MNVLVFNVGSASLKFQVIAKPLDAAFLEQGRTVVSGAVEEFGAEATLSSFENKEIAHQEKIAAADHGLTQETFDDLFTADRPAGDHLLEVDVSSRRSQDINGARRQQRNNHQREQRLQHHQAFRPPRERRRIGRRKGSVGVEGEKQIVEEIGGPALLPDFSKRLFTHHHLRKEEGSI